MSIILFLLGCYSNCAYYFAINKCIWIDIKSDRVLINVFLKILSLDNTFLVKLVRTVKMLI